jgi:hypothetical protein
MTYACRLDLPILSETQSCTSIQSHRRNRQRQCGRRIARQRLIRSATAEAVARCESRYMIEQNAYSSVIFLNQHDIILGADQAGRIDVVRLPRYGSEEHGLGTKLASKVDIRPPCEKSTVVKLKSLQNGEAFAVGLSTGEFRVFATEHASSWREEQRQPVQQRNMPEPRIQLHGWRFLGPRRRYHRNGVDSTRSLLHMLDSHQGNPQLYNMAQVMDWNENDRQLRTTNTWLEHMDFLPGRHPSCNDDARWDFRETPNRLQAAFVDQERDCFSIRFLDNRTKHCFGRPNLIIDTESKDNARSCQEDVSSVCFVSANYLATSHVWKKASDLDPSNAVKLWDVRMMSVRRSGKPVVENVLPSYPLDSVSRARADSTWLTKVSAGETGDCHLLPLSSDTNIDWGCPFSVTRLTSSSDGVGTIMVTLQTTNTGQQTIENMIFDPSAGKVIHRHRSAQAAQPNNTSSVFTVSPSHDLFASYQVGNHSGNSKLAFYDFTPGNEQTQTTKMSRKRSKDDLVRNEEDGNPGYLGEISPNVSDRDGIPSRLTALAFNDTSTSLVGGTLDGDLFVWRGG